MHRHEVLNALAKAYGYKRYLEIGVDNNDTFNAVDMPHKRSVDPNGKATHTMTSDEFFKQNEELFDLVFIDGLHEEEQVTRDFNNALACLTVGGAIVAHDCLPPAQPWESPSLMGTVWRSWARLRATRPDLKMFVVDTDCGCGVIQRGHQELYPLPESFDWTLFAEHKPELMNTISVAHFRLILAAG